MAVTNLGLKSANATFEGNMFTRVFTRVYLFSSDSIYTDDENVVLQEATTLFPMRSRHPTYYWAFVRSINPSLSEDSAFLQGEGTKGALWEVTYEWGPLDPLTQANQEGNPLNDPIKWSWKEENVDEIVYEDKDKNPVMNSAQQYFDPPLTSPRKTGILSVVANVGVIDFDTINSWGNKVNDSPWQGFDTNTVLLLPVDIPEFSVAQAFDNLIYWTLTFNFKIDTNTFTSMVLDQGYEELDLTVDPPVRKLILVEGVPASSPVLLDGNGKALVPPVDKDNIVLLPFDIYDRLDFSALGLDNIPYFPSYSGE